MRTILIGVFLSLYLSLFSQVSINFDGASPDSSSMLDIQSTSKGLLIPRMTAIKRDSIKRPAPGLLIFCTDNNHYYYNKGTPEVKNWVIMLGDGEPVISQGNVSQYWRGDKKWHTLISDSVPEGAVHLYLTNQRVRKTNLTGFTTLNDQINETDSIYSALQKTQGQINSLSGVLHPALTLGIGNGLSINGPFQIISMGLASSGSTGALSSSDWITFYNKQNALTTGNVTPGSSKILITGSPTNSVIGPGLIFDIDQTKIDHNSLLNHNASEHFFQKVIDTINTSLSGLVKATNGNLTAISDNSSTWEAGYFYRLTNAFGTSPLTLTLASNELTGSISKADGTTNGYLSSEDWNNFNSKQNQSGSSLSESTSNVLQITNGNNCVLGTGTSIQVIQANTIQNGYLLSSDYTRLHGTTGSVLFFDGGGIQQNNSKLFWNDQYQRLGIGTSSPSVPLEVAGDVKFNGQLNVSGQLNMNGQKIINLAAPENPGDAVILNYAGLSYIRNSDVLQSGANFHIGVNGWIDGNLVIGTTSAPGYRLDINAASNVMRIQTLPFNYSNTSVLVVDDATGVVSKRTNFFTSGTVTTVTATFPLHSSGGSTPDISLTGIVPVSNGGTGFASYMIGDIPYATGTSALGKLSDVATGNALISGGVGVAPSYGKIGLNTHVSGTLPIANGGTNTTVLSSNKVLVSNTTGTGILTPTNLHWDNTNSRLGILTTAPNATLSVGSSNQFQVAGGDGQTTITSSNAYSFTAISTSSINGTGVIGVGNNQTAATYTSGSGGAFIGNVCGIYGKATNTTGDRFGGYFFVDATNYAYIAAYISGTKYKIIGPGTPSTIVQTTENKNAIMFCPEAPEILLIDYGTGNLTNGKCHIKIDPIFSNNIFTDNAHPLKVFIQVEGECNGVYVNNKTKNGFDVIELKEGSSNITFSWSVIANRKDEINQQGEILSKHKDLRFPEFNQK